LAEPRRLDLVKRECGFETKTEKKDIELLWFVHSASKLLDFIQKELNYIRKEYY